MTKRLLESNENIAIYPEYIDIRFITICDEVRLLQNEGKGEEIVRVWNSLVYKPKLIIFDVTLTLVPFWIDSTHVTPPFYKSSTDFDDQYVITDQENRKMTFFKDAPLILNTLSHQCLKTDGFMAVACKTKKSDAAAQLLKLYEWNCYFNSIQLSKINRNEQINKICNELCIEDKSEILLFQQENQNLIEIRDLGVSLYLVDMKNGIMINDVIKGLKMHNNKFF